MATFNATISNSKKTVIGNVRLYTGTYTVPSNATVNDNIRFTTGFNNLIYYDLCHNNTYGAISYSTESEGSRTNLLVTGLAGNATGKFIIIGT